MAQAKLLVPPLAEAMKKMAGYRNIALHDYQKLLLPITENFIQHHLDEFSVFTSALIKQTQPPAVVTIATIHADAAK